MTKETGQRVAALLALKVEEGATDQGVRVSFGSWKRQGNRFAPELSEMQLFWHLDFSLLRSALTFYPIELLGSKVGFF